LEKIDLYGEQLERRDGFRVEAAAVQDDEDAALNADAESDVDPEYNPYASGNEDELVEEEEEEEEGMITSFYSS
jgi:hypothetical protein